MNRLAPTRIAALVLCCALLSGIVPSYAYAPSAPPTDPLPVVPSHAIVAGHDLYGMEATQAAAAIAAGVVVPTLARVVVKGKAAKPFSFAAKDAVSVDVSATLLKAYDATDTVATYTLTPALVTKPGVANSWASTIAKKTDRSSKNAYRSVKKRALVLHAEIVGYHTDKAKTAAAITAVLASECASSGSKPAAISASIASIKPKVTRKNITKAIIIVLGQFRIKLYNHGKIEKTYPCATGMAKYPTPTGKFKVTGKVKNPVWHNPYSSWSMHMPATIKGGVNNPLGTRAIYTSAPGIRMHGVPASENWSIGHRASHGCLRMHRHDAENLYPRVPVGITVWIVK